MTQYVVTVSTKQIPEVASASANTQSRNATTSTIQSKRIFDNKITRVINRTFFNAQVSKQVIANQQFYDGSVNPDLTYTQKIIPSVAIAQRTPIPQKTFTKQVIANIPNIQGYVGNSVYYASASFGNQVDAQESLKWNTTDITNNGNAAINVNTTLFGTFVMQTTNNSNTGVGGGNNYNRSLIENRYPRLALQNTTNPKFVYFVSGNGLLRDITERTTIANIRGRLSYTANDDLGILIGWNDTVPITGNTPYLDVSTTNTGYQINDEYTTYSTRSQPSTSQVVTIINAATNSAIIYRNVTIASITDRRLLREMRYTPVVKTVQRSSSVIISYPFARFNKTINGVYKIPQASYALNISKIIQNQGVCTQNVLSSYIFSKPVRENPADFNYYATPKPDNFNMHIVTALTKRDTITKRVAAGGGGSKYTWS